MFNNNNLSEKEILYIIEKFRNYIRKESYINRKFDEDLNQEIKIRIYKTLTKGRKNKKSKKIKKNF